MHSVLSKSLACFSFALGAVELLAPRALTRSLGMRPRSGLVRAYGLREIGAGALTLASPAAGLWSRVAGDALDIATLLAGDRPGNHRRSRVRLALASVVAITALDLAAAASHSHA